MSGFHLSHKGRWVGGLVFTSVIRDAVADGWKQKWRILWQVEMIPSGEADNVYTVQRWAHTSFFLDALPLLLRFVKYHCFKTPPFLSIDESHMCWLNFHLFYNKKIHHRKQKLKFNCQHTVQQSLFCTTGNTVPEYR